MLEYDGDTNKEIYMGLRSSGMHIPKRLYGLKQAARHWCWTSDNFVSSDVRGENDSLYLKEIPTWAHLYRISTNKPWCQSLHYHSPSSRVAQRSLNKRVRRSSGDQRYQRCKHTFRCRCGLSFKLHIWNWSMAFDASDVELEQIQCSCMEIWMTYTHFNLQAS
jgi:hypothetical protein